MRIPITLLLFTIIALVAIVTVACKQTQEPAQDNQVVEETQISDQTPEASVEIVAGKRSPGFSGAKARFTNLTDGEVLKSNELSVVVDVENYQLGTQTNTPRAKEIANSAQGQHAHIILDNDPYFADYEAGVPFDIGTLDEGAHTLIVFPSRSYHESVKADGSIDIVNFYVGKQQGEFMLDESKPNVIYSRPKGKYEGKDAEKIMLDFYLINAELGDDYQAKYTIRKDEADATEYTITMTEWTPAFVTGLTSGDYIITLQLLDGNGNIVEGPFNNTERKITVATE
ncbi:MAG: hypothetical protein AAF462_00245 [Thermodesulfobacteriota bacterium]